MDKRLLRLGILLFSGLIAWVVLRQYRERANAVPTMLRHFEPEATPVEAEVEDAIEAPPHIREADPVELAFVAGAISGEETLGSDLEHEADAAEPAPPEAAEADGEHPRGALIGYCLRCHTKREISNAQIEVTKDGRHAARGTCAVCGAKIVRFVKDTA